MKRNNLWFEELETDRLLGRKRLAILLDPDKVPKGDQLVEWLMKIESSRATDVFIGGSHLCGGDTAELVSIATQHLNKPVVLFPGSPEQAVVGADIMLLLSLVSGRNADLLIGRHVEVAPRLISQNISTVSTAYILIGDGPLTTASYISQTLPIPSAKPDLAVATAQAAVLLGMKVVYLDAGSGAGDAILSKTISAVRRAVDVPIIVGGGIRNTNSMENAWEAGADLVVMGTAFEEDHASINKLSETDTN